MLRLLNEVIGYRLQAVDDQLGAVNDFLFDDKSWEIRYLVADTKAWLPGQLVLLYTDALERPAWETRTFSLSITKEKLKNSPQIAENQPVSRQKEAELFTYYAWDPYWSFGNSSPELVYVPDAKQTTNDYDPHLRSVSEITGYKVDTADGDCGVVDDFVVDDDGWVIRYLVLKTRKWLPGKKILLPPSWLSGIHWSEQQIQVDVPSEQLKNSPEFDPNAPINRQYEERLYDFYGRPAYWLNANVGVPS